MMNNSYGHLKVTNISALVHGVQNTISMLYAFVKNSALNILSVEKTYTAGW